MHPGHTVICAPGEALACRLAATRTIERNRLTGSASCPFFCFSQRLPCGRFAKQSHILSVLTLWASVSGQGR